MTNQSKAPEIIAQKLQTMAADPNLTPPDAETLKLADTTIRMLQRSSGQNYKKIVELNDQIEETKNEEKRENFVVPIIERLEEKLDKLLMENEVLANSQIEITSCIAKIFDSLGKQASVLKSIISTNDEVLKTIAKNTLKEKPKISVNTGLA